MKINQKPSMFVAVLSLGIMGLLSACSSDTDVANMPSNPSSTSPSTTSTTPSVNISSNHADIAKALSDNLAKSEIDAKVLEIKETKIPDIYMAIIDGMPPIFTDKTGQFIIQGQIVQIGGATPIDITDEMNAAIAKQALEAIAESEMIVFPAQGEKKTHIYVFSDPTCHYCQLLHKEIDKTTAGGVEVRYLAWPRSEQVVPMTEAIWCSSDKQTAITKAKIDLESVIDELSAVPKCDNPVEKQMALGFQLGVSGTPAVFTENGTQIGGYLPSDKLIQTAMNYR